MTCTARRDGEPYRFILPAAPAATAAAAPAAAPASAPRVAAPSPRAVRISTTHEFSPPYNYTYSIIHVIVIIFLCCIWNQFKTYIRRRIKRTVHVRPAVKTGRLGRCQQIHHGRTQKHLQKQQQQHLLQPQPKGSPQFLKQEPPHIRFTPSITNICTID